MNNETISMISTNSIMLSLPWKYQTLGMLSKTLDEAQTCCNVDIWVQEGYILEDGYGNFVVPLLK